MRLANPLLQFHCPSWVIRGICPCSLCLPVSLHSSRRSLACLCTDAAILRRRLPRGYQEAAELRLVGSYLNCPFPLLSRRTPFLFARNTASLSKSCFVAHRTRVCTFSPPCPLLHATTYLPHARPLPRSSNHIDHLLPSPLAPLPPRSFLTHTYAALHAPHPAALYRTASNNVTSSRL